MWTVFLKLGGSLLTDKRQQETPRLDVIRRLADEIAMALSANRELQLVVGHGSGSYGHVHGLRYGTRDGVHTSEQWYGYAVTADAAARLHRVFVSALLQAGIPAWGIQPSAALRCQRREIIAGPEMTVALALEKGLTPVVHGDVALDTVLGGTIVSTEEIFKWMLPHFRPQRLVLAGEVDGIHTADPQIDRRATLIPEIRPDSMHEIRQGLGGSHGMDVTGGMLAKVSHSLDMVQAHPELDVIVCSGMQPGNVEAVLSDPACVRGTRIAA
jgi:isopentenyl phosphate kinase